MIVSINQPAYLPWLGYFHRIASSDVHVVLDHVQLEKNSFTNRNRIRTKDGSVMLTVPIATKGKFGDLKINECEIAQNSNWQKKHKNSLELNYRKAPYFDKYFPFFESIYDQPWSRLNDLISTINIFLLECLNIHVDIRYSSRLNAEGKKSDLVLNLCRELGAKTYLSGALGRDYLEEGKFNQYNISVRYHDYKHPTYDQLYREFQLNMSVIDLLFNHGEKSMKILSSAMREDYHTELQRIDG